MIDKSYIGKLIFRVPVGFLGIVAAIWESVIISTAVSLTVSAMVVNEMSTVMMAGGSVEQHETKCVYPLITYSD